MTVILHSAADAAVRLSHGALVAIPTETVYGLAADARNLQAVSRVFTVKGRPLDHPVIVHLARAQDAAAWAREIDPRLQALMHQHWPGPLTVVVPKAAWVSELITGGQDTVALRVPSHPMAQQVIAALGDLQGEPAGVVAPSANRFGRVSPTTAAHVQADLGAVLEDHDAILDGGSCQIGVESTVVALVGDQIRVLRPGGAGLIAGGARQTESGPTGPIAVSSAVGTPQTPRAPGTLASHYAPRAQVVMATVEDLPRLQHELAGKGAALIAPAEVATPPGWDRVAAPRDDADYARGLYAAMRAADELHANILIAVPPAQGPLAAAVRDRLVRAAAGSSPSA